MWGNIKYFSYLCSEIIHIGFDTIGSISTLHSIPHRWIRIKKSYANEHIYWPNRMSCR